MKDHGRQYEYERDRLPGGPAYDDKTFEERISYIERLVESINQKTKEIEMIKKILNNQF